MSATPARRARLFQWVAAGLALTLMPVSAGIVSAQEGPRVGAVGDSVLLGAQGDLEARFPSIQVDGEVGRQMDDGLALLHAEAASDTLPPVMVVDLGNNGPITDAQMDDLLSVLANQQRVVVVNVKVPRAWEAGNNAVIAAAVQRSNNAVLVDWYSASASNPDLFWDDGLHLRPAGAELYAELVAEAIDQ